MAGGGGKAAGVCVCVGSNGTRARGGTGTAYMWGKAV